MILRSLIITAVAGTAAVLPAQAAVLHDLTVANPSANAKLDLSLEPQTEAKEPEIQYTEAEVVKGVIDLVQSDPRAALKQLTAAVTPNSSAMLDFIIGNLNFQLDERADALRYYQSAVRKAPFFAKAHKNLGFLALQSEKMDEALKSFIKTVQLGSAEGAVYGLIGYIYLNTENYLSAESAYRDAMLKMPENVDWKLGLGRAVLAHQKHADVMNVMGELISKDPKKRDYWLVQANAFLSMERVMDAAYDYEIMARLGLGTKDTFYALGNIYASQDMPPLALIAYMAAVNLQDPPTMETMLGAAEIMGARGAIEESSTLAARVSEVYGKNATKEEMQRLLKLRSQLAIIREDQTAAEGFLEDLIKIDENDGETILLLADFYSRGSRYEKSIPLYEKAEELDEFAIDALVKHGQALVSENRYDEAIEKLEKATAKLAQTENETRYQNVSRYLESVRRVARNAR